VTHQLDAGDAGQDAVDHRAVGPGGVQHLAIEQPAGIDVLAAQVGVRCDALVEIAMELGDRAPSFGRNLSGNDRDQVEVADPRYVVARGQRPGHPEVGGPAQLAQPAPELLDRLG
jgi:hypothetical protein